MNTQLGALNSSHDEAGKFNYYADANDTFTTYFAHGAENYNFYEPQTGQTNFFDPDQSTLTGVDGTKFKSTPEHWAAILPTTNVQTYNLDHFTYKHQFGPASFLQYRIYQFHQAIPTHEEGTGGAFVFSRTNETGNQLDFYNQLNKTNVLKAGLTYEDAKGSYERQVIFNGPGGPGPDGSKWECKLPGPHLRRDPSGLCFLPGGSASGGAEQTCRQLRPALPKHYVQPQEVIRRAGSRAATRPKRQTHASGVSYTPVSDLSFHSSLTYDSQRPDMRRLQRLGPLDVGDLPTASTPAAAAAENAGAANFGTDTFNRLKMSNTNMFDLGVDKGLRSPGGIFQGSYDVSLTGYNKWVRNLAFLNAPNYVDYPGVHSAYDNEGKEKASGFEFSFRKLQRRPSDWNGYINYTNQVVRTNSSLYDTAYAPYFVTELASSGAFTEGQLQGYARQQFSPSWDQRHTVAVVATKSFIKQLESTFILDAGSGLPFYPSAFLDLAVASALQGTGFAEIGAV